MKLRNAAAASMIVMGVAGMTTNTNAQSGNGAASSVASTQVAAPKLERTIRVGGLVFDSLSVMKMTFSPDSRYLGIVAWSSASTTEIVVWDMKHDRQQSRIHCECDFATNWDDQLLWSPDGKAIFFGAKWQWDPMTGNALPDTPVIGGSARLNKDGSKLLTIVDSIGDPGYVYVYDTKTWALQKIYADGLTVQTASWTADDKILVSSMMTLETRNKTVDGHFVQGYDTAIRLLDPSGKDKTKAVWFPQQPTNDPRSPYTYAFSVGAQTQTHFATNQIFLITGEIIDGATLSIRHYHSFDETNTAPGATGMGISPDGKFLYLKGATFAEPGHKPIENTIVDIASGNPVLQFSGAMGDGDGLAVSPDGRYLTLANGRSVLVFDLR